jgi:hypothetical protein
MDTGEEEVAADEATAEEATTATGGRLRREALQMAPRVAQTPIEPQRLTVDAGGSNHRRKLPTAAASVLARRRPRRQITTR